MGCPQWQFVAPLARVFAQLNSSPLSERFRAGTSLYHLIISTAAKHGLEPDEPFVSVSMDRTCSMLEVTYWCRTGGQVLDRKLCTEAEAPGEIDRKLTRLWKDSKGEQTAV